MKARARRPERRRQPAPKRSARTRPATSVGRREKFSPATLLRDHIRVLMASLGRLYRNPGSNLMTAMVVGIALALPGTLLVVLDNLQQVTGGWQGSTTISLYLKSSAGGPGQLREQLADWPEISAVDAITRDQALKEFRQLSGFGDALDSLDGNPLPDVLVVTPGAAHAGPEASEALLERLRRQPGVDLAQLDLQWLKRLTAIMELGRRAVLAIALLLGLGVLLIIGNTIRLEIQNRREEIEVTKLVGGTNAFIRRPFLYTGCWHGLFGALIAWLLLRIGVWALDGPVHRLAGLYASDFHLQFLEWRQAAVLLLAGILLGLLGSWLAVGRHLKDIEPA